MKRKLCVKSYFRYADDFIIIHHSKEYLEKILLQIEKFLRTELKLELHPDKVYIRKFHQGIDFLGYVALPKYTVLRTKTKKRMFKKISAKYEELQNGEIFRESFNQSLRSYPGVLKHCEGHKIKKAMLSATGLK